MKKYVVDGNGKRRVQPADSEVDQFLFECGLYKLEPLAGQIYAHWENGVMRAVTTIDGMRVLAERTGLYEGQSDPEWCDASGNWTDYWNGDQEPTAARVRVHKKGTAFPTTGTANWFDFAPEDRVGANASWSMSGEGKPGHMLSIRAEALALRKAFPLQLSGLYTAEELGISLAEIGAVAEEPFSPAAAIDVPLAPSAPTPPIPEALAAPDVSDRFPAGIVDSPAGQSSGAPARPQVKRTLAEALASGEYEKLHGDLTKALFDQMPDLLTEEQSGTLSAALAEAESAGITPHELERSCKLALEQENVAGRSWALLEWITERRKKAEEAEHPGLAERGTTRPEPAEPGSRPAADPDRDQSPPPIEGDPGPEERE